MPAFASAVHTSKAKQALEGTVDHQITHSGLLNCRNEMEKSNLPIKECS